MPSLGLNLISASRLQSYSLITPEKALMFSENRLLTIGEQIRGLYYLPVEVIDNKVLQTLNRKRPAFEALEPSEQSKRIKHLEEALSKANEALEKAKAPAPSKEKREADKARRATLSLWHQRLGHVNERVIKYLLKDLYHESGNPIGALEEHFRKCEPCKKASFTNKVNRKSRNATKEY